MMAMGFNLIIVARYSLKFLLFGSLVTIKSALNGEFFCSKINEFYFIGFLLI